MATLDGQIKKALAQLRSSPSDSKDAIRYIEGFAQSGRDKAAKVLKMLGQSNREWSGLRPVFVSIGGGDGEELQHLLSNSTAHYGVLLELVPEFCKRASNRKLSAGKRIEIVQGDAQQKIGEAMELARTAIRSAQGEFIAVTCHAILHELYDRSSKSFDPLGFFSRIFENDSIPIWLTYREPQVPDDWPPEILLTADCKPHSLCELAKVIAAHHSDLQTLKPAPQVTGKYVRMHKILAMETLVKLFYIENLAHEMGERSTSVDHSTFISHLHLSAGSKSQAAPSIETESAPTESFREHWQRCKIELVAINDKGAPRPLAMAESQIRIQVWRPAAFDREFETRDSMAVEVNLARSACETSDNTLLAALLASRGRQWVESHNRGALDELFSLVQSRCHESTIPFQLSLYYSALLKLFADRAVDPELFSESFIKQVQSPHLKLLFTAERMEFCRRNGDIQAAATLANMIRKRMESLSAPSDDLLARYAFGTAQFLIGNLLREGGSYSNAMEYIDRAASSYVRGIGSHDAELAHCHYSRAVCVAMTGVSAFTAPEATDDDLNSNIFASSLIKLTLSHSAWFINKISEAIAWARKANEGFTRIGFQRHALRSSQLAALLTWWEDLTADRQLANIEGQDRLLRLVRGVTEKPIHADNKPEDLLSAIRPSFALGLLQFGATFGSDYDAPRKVTLPRLVQVSSDNSISLVRGLSASSLTEADTTLRSHLSVPLGRRVPLIAD